LRGLIDDDMVAAGDRQILPDHVHPAVPFDHSLPRVDRPPPLAGLGRVSIHGAEYAGGADPAERTFWWGRRNFDTCRAGLVPRRRADAAGAG
jgi:hypothetical protein